MLIPKTNRVLQCYRQCTSKLLCKRLTEVLNYQVDKSQWTFIPGKSLVQKCNALLGDPLRLQKETWVENCILKIACRKAYDSVHFDFVIEKN